MGALSMDLRERIISSYEAGEGTRQEVADRFCVSLGMVKKLINQKRHLGDLSPQYQNMGRKPLITEKHREKFKKLLEREPDLTLEELKEALGLGCSIQAIHYVLKKMGWSYKKNTQSNRTGPRGRG